MERGRGADPERTGSPVYLRMLPHLPVLRTSITAKPKLWLLIGYSGGTCYAAKEMCVMQATPTTRRRPLQVQVQVSTLYKYHSTYNIIISCKKKTRLDAKLNRLLSLSTKPSLNPLFYILAPRFLMKHRSTFEMLLKDVKCHNLVLRSSSKDLLLNKCI